MSNTKCGGLRAFGFAGKLFPTLNVNEIVKENAANFFLVDDLGGTRAKHYTDVVRTNAPNASKTSALFKSILYALRVARGFSKVDKNPGVRQLYEISQLGERGTESVLTPRWMKIAAKPRANGGCN